MQIRNLALAGVLLAMMSLIASAADISGTWSGSASSPNGEFSLTYVFQQEGAKLTVTVSTPQGDLPIQEGKVEGDHISFLVKTDLDGGPVTFTVKGVVKGDEIALVSTNDAGMDIAAQMTLKRQK